MDKLVTFVGRPGRVGNDSIAIHNMEPFVVTATAPEMTRRITDQDANREGFASADDFAEFLFGAHGVYNAGYSTPAFTVADAPAESMDLAPPPAPAQASAPAQPETPEPAAGPTMVVQASDQENNA